jgi:hypothetical protein
MSDFGQQPSPQDLQFQQAEPLPAEPVVDPNAPRCVVCKNPIGATYYHAQGHTVCPGCAQKIQTGQQAPAPVSLARAFLYGAGAAVAGSILYAAVAILLNLEIGIIAIVVGFMVGKAIRHASNGLGGRPQQILAVVLTYFSITSSYIPVFLYQWKHDPKRFEQSRQAAEKRKSEQAAEQRKSEQAAAPNARRPGIGVIGALVTLLVLFAAAPFFSLANGIGGLISLFIIFIGLRQAWKLTGRTQILVMGPYESAAPAQ